MRATVLYVALLVANAASANETNASAGTLPGDEQLTCEQIYEQGMAESQREQQARNQKLEQMKRQNAATATLITGATMAGGLGGTGQAAQAAAEATADRQIAMLGEPPSSNPRKDHLKQLWTQKHCVKK